MDSWSPDKSERSCVKCGITQDHSAFLSEDGKAVQKQCYICQICSVVIGDRHDLETRNTTDPDAVRTEIKANALVRLSCYKDNQRSKGSSSRLDELYSEIKLLSRINKLLDEKQGRGFTSEGPQVDEQARTMREGERDQARAGASNSHGASYESDSESVSTDSPAGVPTHDVDTSRAGPQARGTTTKTMRIQASRKCVPCHQSKHWAYFMSLQNGLELAKTCVNCRLVKQISTYAENEDSPLRSKGTKTNAVRKAMEEKFEPVLAKWKGNVIQHVTGNLEHQSNSRRSESNILEGLYEKVFAATQQALKEKWDSVNGTTKRQSLTVQKSTKQSQSQRKTNGSRGGPRTRPKNASKKRNHDELATHPESQQPPTPVSADTPKNRPAKSSSGSTRPTKTPRLAVGPLDGGAVRSPRSGIDPSTPSCQNEEQSSTLNVKEALELMFEQFNRVQKLSEEVESSPFLPEIALEGSLSTLYLKLVTETSQTFKRLTEFYIYLQGLQKLGDK